MPTHVGRQYLGYLPTYLIYYGRYCIAMSVCIFLFYHEIKGKSLDEMIAIFSGHILTLKDAKNSVFTTEKMTMTSHVHMGQYQSLVSDILLCGVPGNADARMSKQIDRQIKLDGKRSRTEVKILLLGVGGSGKSTVHRQLRLIHDTEFNAMERKNFRLTIFHNLIESMQALLFAMSETDVPFYDTQLEKKVPLLDQLPEVEPDEPYPTEYFDLLEKLWKDKNVQSVYRIGSASSLCGNMAYYYRQLDRLWEPDYIPTDQDILKCHVNSGGLVETIFHLNSLYYRVVDVGGQRSIRKKWIHYFDNVTAVLFIAAISGYDQCLLEDRHSMHEALMLFDTICNSPWFQTTSMILFLNKIDIFKTKIQSSPVSHWFPDYEGDDHDYEQTCNYFKQRFLRLNHNNDKPVYVYFTDATNTGSIETIMTTVLDTILNDNLYTFML